MSKKQKKKNNKSKAYSFYKKPSKARLFLKFLKWLFVLFIWGIIAATILVLVNLHDLPEISTLKEKTRRPTITIKNTENEILATFGDIYGRAIKFEQIPDSLIKAVIATEDRRYYDHLGFDVIGLLRAFYANQKAGKIVQGGSTITQQLAKMVFLNPNRTLKRKIQELVLALWLENQLTKEQILEQYLNRVYLGSGLYGVDAASQYYFGKSIENINIYESALIAGLLKAPSKYDPTIRPELSKQRADQVLLNMVDAGYLNKNSLNILPTYQIMSKGSLRGSMKNPYFADWINELIHDYLDVINDDIIVITTLDSKMQNKAEQVITSYIEKNGPNLNISQAALITLAPDGAVKAMVGGVDYRKSQFNRAVHSSRQSGSIFKIFPYITALENGFELDSIIKDAPLNIGQWKPENFAKKYLGDITLDEAFSRSLNIPAIRITEELGYTKVANTAKRFGIKSYIPLSPSMALGSADVNLMEMTNSYSIIANGGYKTEPYAILKILDSKNNILYEKDHNISNYPQIIRKNILEKTLTLLYNSVNNEKATGKKARLDIYETFGKTGTSHSFNDAWFIGFTYAFTTGVWVGNDNLSSMKQVTGGTVPPQIWHDYMQYSMQDLANKSLIKGDYPLDRSVPSSLWNKVKSIFD